MAESPRQIVYDAVQSTHNYSEAIEGAVLIGFALVAEWVAPDGERWLTRLSGGPDESIPPWQERSYFREGVEWQDDVTDEDDEDD